MTFISTPLHSVEAEQLYNQLLTCIATHNARLLHKSVEAASSVTLPPVFRKLTDNERVTIWVLLSSKSPQLAAILLDHFSDDELVSLMSQLPLEVTISLFQHLRSEDRRMLINQLPSELQSQLKRALPQTWKSEEKAALIYSTNTVGGICKSEILKLNEEATVADLGNMLRAEDQSSDHLEWRYVYLHDGQGVFLGGLKIREMLLLPHGAKLKEHLDPSIPVTSPDLDLYSLKSVLDTTLHPIIPVVNEHGFQIGVVGFKHLNEALYELSKQQLLEQSGVFGGDEFRTMSTLTRNLRRLAFLLPSVILSYAAVSIIAAYEPIIEQIAVLAAILPLVANLSGAAGNQAVAVSIRELSMGHISAKDLLYVIAKEVPIGIINGVLIGSVLAILTLVTHDSEHIGLPFLIGIAYACSSTLAVMVGGSLPLLLKRWNLDPAMLSSPVLTTLTDAISFFSVLYLAQSFLL